MIFHTWQFPQQHLLTIASDKCRQVILEALVHIYTTGCRNINFIVLNRVILHQKFVLYCITCYFAFIFVLRWLMTLQPNQLILGLNYQRENFKNSHFIFPFSWKLYSVEKLKIDSGSQFYGLFLLRFRTTCEKAKEDMLHTMQFK